MAKSCRSSAKEQTDAIKDQNGQLLVQWEDIADRWREYFVNLLNGQRNTPFDRDPDLEADVEEMIEDITDAELLEAMARMKRGKATGDDHLPVEIVNAAGERAWSFMLTIMQKYRQEALPSEWQKGVINPIFKKGDRAAWENYREITLLSHWVKLFSSIIERRLHKHVESRLREWQYGFRSGRGTSDLIFIMIIMKKNWEWRREKFALFVDMEKAFDYVPRQLLWNIILEPRT